MEGTHRLKLGTSGCSVTRYDEEYLYGLLSHDSYEFGGRKPA